STLQSALRERIEAKALHNAASGAPREYRIVARSLQNVRNVMLDLAGPLWNEVSGRLPPGMASNAVLDLQCEQDEYLRFLESKLKLRIATGEHDASAVPINELGSGLQ